MHCLERSGKDPIGVEGKVVVNLTVSLYPIRIAGRITIVRRNRLRVFVGCRIGHLFVWRTEAV